MNAITGAWCDLCGAVLNQVDITTFGDTTRRLLCWCPGGCVPCHCGHYRDEHSEFLVGEPCLDCVCVGFISTLQVR